MTAVLPDPFPINSESALKSYEIADGSFAGIESSANRAAQILAQDTALIANSVRRLYVLGSVGFPGGQPAIISLHLLAGATLADPVAVVSAMMFGSQGGWTAAGARAFMMSMGAGALLFVETLLRARVPITPLPLTPSVGVAHPATPGLKVITAGGGATDSATEQYTLNGVNLTFTVPAFK